MRLPVRIVEDHRLGIREQPRGGRPLAKSGLDVARRHDPRGIVAARDQRATISFGGDQRSPSCPSSPMPARHHRSGAMEGVDEPRPQRQYRRQPQARLFGADDHGGPREIGRQSDQHRQLGGQGRVAAVGIAREVAKTGRAPDADRGHPRIANPGAEQRLVHRRAHPQVDRQVRLDRGQCLDDRIEMRYQQRLAEKQERDLPGHDRTPSPASASWSCCHSAMSSGRSISCQRTFPAIRTARTPTVSATRRTTAW